MSEANQNEDDLGSMKERFVAAENVVNEIGSGRTALKDLQIRIEDATLSFERLTTEVSALALFSSNETVDELPTTSLPFLLLPCYLGVLHHNTMVETDRKEEEMVMAKVYYRDFLKRIKQYEVIKINLPFRENESTEEEGEDAVEIELKPNPYLPMSGTMNGKPAMTGEDYRQAKMMRYRLQRDFQSAMEHARKMYKETNGDESYLRELYLSQLQYWATKCLEELSSIDAELPLIKLMSQRRAEQPDKNKTDAPRPAPLKPFIIARTEQQKKVLGIGYPAIPTMTVDEWYQQRFGDGPGPGSSAGPSSSGAQKHSHGADEECHSGSEHEDDVDEDASRLAAMRMDDYKDTHRRGWGNTHNKG